MTDSNAVETLRTPNSRRTKLQWLAASMALVGLVMVVVPARQIRMGERELNGLVDSYLYETITPSPTTYTIDNLRITDIYQPTTLRVEWNTSAPNPINEAKRTLSGSTQETITTSNNYWMNSFSWTYGLEYRYSVRNQSWRIGTILGLPSPPPGASAGDINVVIQGGSGPWSTIAAVPTTVTVTDNQTVDSRYDLRFSTYTNLDHNFGTTSYRGGLFAGYAADAARVGRSFLNFTTTAASPSGDTCWAGRVYGYYVRSLASGSTTVGLQAVSSSWSGSTLKWSNAPSLTPGSPLNSVNVTHGTPGWYSWNVNAAITGTTMASPFAAGIASTSETSNGWAYFAKKEWDSSYAPYLLYVTGGAR